MAPTEDEKYTGMDNENINSADQKTAKLGCCLVVVLFILASLYVVAVTISLILAPQSFTVEQRLKKLETVFNSLSQRLSNITEQETKSSTQILELHSIVEMHHRRPSEYKQLFYYYICYCYYNFFIVFVRDKIILIFEFGSYILTRKPQR